jgi:hypothetical protein
MNMTYTSLYNQVLSYLDRTDIDTASQLPYFIAQAQQRICREVISIGLEQYVTGNLIKNLAVYQKPAGWRRSITFNVGTGVGNNSRTPVELRSYEYLISYSPDRTKTGTPKYYADYLYDNFVVAPTPDFAYPFEFAYLQLPPSVTLQNQTNWITDFAPDVLLYATLLEAIPYLKDDERVPIWQNMYKMGIDSLNDQDSLRVDDRQSDRRSD